MNALACYNQGEPGRVGSTGTGSNHLLPLEGKQMAGQDATRIPHLSVDPILGVMADPAKRASLVRRMALKVRRGDPGECWEWTAKASCAGGYGAINAGRGPRLRAHRVAWAIAGGDLPPGQVLCHRCDNPKCCNPDHLFLGTHADNSADMRSKGRGSSPPIRTGDRHHKVTIPDASLPSIIADGRSLGEISRAYGVSIKTIWRIKHGLSRASRRVSP